MHIQKLRSRLRCNLRIVSFTLCLMAGPAMAAINVGSKGVANADSNLSRPTGTPCAVQLFSDTVFEDFNAHPYAYAPPKGCDGGWSKVVLEADFSVDPGVQFDRTASLWLSGVNLYFGTTQEPSSSVAPSWHAERDLTDYSALLRQSGKGQVMLANGVDKTYTSAIHGSAKLLFYPATTLEPAPGTPDAIYPLGSDAIGATTDLKTSNDLLSKALTLPRNIDRAYLDVFTQSQGDDEFWYYCNPDKYKATLDDNNTCSNGSFREAEISIDDQPAGVAPVYPYIYTGGMDPALWRPTTGIQALNFIPYRVDLTPFAGVLSDGISHTVALRVVGASHRFTATASLLVFLDSDVEQISGKVTRNTLADQPPIPTFSDTLTTDTDGNVNGTINTKLSRSFVIEGYVDNSYGRVASSVAQTVGFAATHDFANRSGDPSFQHEVINQLTSVSSVSTRKLGSNLVAEYDQTLSYPLKLDSTYQSLKLGPATSLLSVEQSYEQHRVRKLAGATYYESDLTNSLGSSNAAIYDASGKRIASNGVGGWQSFLFKDTGGSCYNANAISHSFAVTSYTAGVNCPDHSNKVGWSSHPDGSPDSGSTVLGW